jgi:hypothetical protein
MRDVSDDPTKMLRTADGEIVSVTDIPDKPGVAIAGAAVDLLPKTYMGFANTLTRGPYPPDAPNSHRQAMYVSCVAFDEPAISLCKGAGGAGEIRVFSELFEDWHALPEAEQVKMVERMWNEARGLIASEMRRQGKGGK